MAKVIQANPGKLLLQISVFAGVAAILATPLLAQSDLPGQTVYVTHGSEVDAFSLNVAFKAVVEAGGPVQVRTLGRSDRIVVQTGDKGWSTTDANDAAAWAIDHCKP